MVKKSSNINGKKSIVETGDLSNGLYFILLKTENKQVSCKLIIDN